MVKTIGNGFVSLNTNTNWRVESTIALSKMVCRKYILSFSDQNASMISFIFIQNISS